MNKIFYSIFHRFHLSKVPYRILPIKSHDIKMEEVDNIILHSLRSIGWFVRFVSLFADECI